jgi:hypothetical protein
MKMQQPCSTRPRNKGYRNFQKESIFAFCSAVLQSDIFAKLRGNSPYAYYEKTFNVAETVAFIEVLDALDGSGSGKAFFDDFRIRDRNLLANGRFEVRSPTGQERDAPGWEFGCGGAIVDGPETVRSGRYALKPPQVGVEAAPVGVEAAPVGVEAAVVFTYETPRSWRHGSLSTTPDDRVRIPGGVTNQAMSPSAKIASLGQPLKTGRFPPNDPAMSLPIDALRGASQATLPNATVPHPSSSVRQTCGSTATHRCTTTNRRMPRSSPQT